MDISPICFHYFPFFLLYSSSCSLLRSALVQQYYWCTNNMLLLKKTRPCVVACTTFNNNIAVNKLSAPSSSLAFFVTSVPSISSLPCFVFFTLHIITCPSLVLLGPLSSSSLSSLFFISKSARPFKQQKQTGFHCWALDVQYCWYLASVPGMRNDLADKDSIFTYIIHVRNNES